MIASSVGILSDVLLAVFWFLVAVAMLGLGATLGVVGLTALLRRRARVDRPEPEGWTHPEVAVGGNGPVGAVAADPIAPVAAAIAADLMPRA